MDSVIDWLEYLLEEMRRSSSSRMAISIVETLYERFKTKAVKIRGGVSQKARLEAVERFQTDPECKIFLGEHRSSVGGADPHGRQYDPFSRAAMGPTNHETARRQVLRPHQRHARRCATLRPRGDNFRYSDLHLLTVSARSRRRSRVAWTPVWEPQRAE